MGWKACVKGRMDSEKGRMKIRLLDWGRVAEQCGRRQETMKRLIKLREEQKKLMEENDSPSVAILLEEIDRKYEEEMARLQGDILEKLEQKKQMDGLLQGLTEEEQKFVGLRFEKGHGFDYIGMKMCMSRATLFRVQDRILEKLLQAEEHETAQDAGGDIMKEQWRKEAMRMWQREEH